MMDPLSNRHDGADTTINTADAEQTRLERNRLMAALNQGLGSRLTLVVGPDGCGKSTLLQEWAEQSPAPAVLVTAERDGCTAETMLRKLAAALARVKPELADTAPVEPIEPEACMVALINEMAAYPGEIAVVIDNYQPRPETDELLGFLLEHLPPQLHIYLAVEQAPTIPSLPRMRVRRQLTELTQRELLLSAGEIAELARRLGFELTDDELETLADVSHGCVGELVTLLDNAAGNADPYSHLRASLAS
jgi:LuxR family maltose regulon positive regulatory protein